MIKAHYADTRWCLVADDTVVEGCPSANPRVFLPPWGEVQLASITPSLGFFGLRNTAWAGSISVQSAAGHWEVILSSFGRIRLCESEGGDECQ